MKKLLRILMLAAAFMILSGCEPATYYYSEAYVNAYTHAPLRLVISNKNMIGCRIRWYYENDKYKYSIWATGKDKEYYNALCQKHGDTSYNRKIRCIDGIRTGAAAYWKDFVSLEVVSNADYDAAHPAGTSLNDIIMFYTKSPKEYIRSGYTMIYDYSTGTVVKQTTIETGEYYPIEKRADLLNSEDMTLLGELHDFGYLFDLSFMKGPDDTSKTHTISVKLTADDGTVYDLSIDYVFE